MTEPFDRVENLTVEYVDSAAGSGKTLTSIAVALDRAKKGVKTIFAMPTLELVREMVEFAQRSDDVPVIEITSRENEEGRRHQAVTELIRQHIIGENNKGNEPPVSRGGHLLFITHAAFHRMGVDWPEETRESELFIDETPEVILTRQPFKLRDSHYTLSSFLGISPVERRQNQHQPSGLLHQLPRNTC